MQVTQNDLECAHEQNDGANMYDACTLLRKLYVPNNA
jgi:hypothetical protein